LKNEKKPKAKEKRGKMRAEIRIIVFLPEKRGEIEDSTDEQWRIKGLLRDYQRMIRGLFLGGEAKL
jgi:hypothetical protein